MLTLRRIVLAILPLLFALPALAQVRGFTPYPNAYDMRELAVDVDDGLWIASNGGLLRFDLQDGSWRTYPRRVLGGPGDNDVTAVAIDDLGQVWTGSAARGVTFYDPAADRWTIFEEWPDPRIRAIRTAGESVFIGTQDGLSLRFRPDRTTICNPIDTGCIVPSFVVNDYAALGDTLWVATQNGLGRWNGATWDSLSFLPPGSGGDCRSLEVFQGELWRALPGNVEVLRGGVWVSTRGGADRLRVTSGGLYAIAGTTVQQWTGSTWVDLLGGTPLPTGVNAIRDLAVEEVGGTVTVFLATNRGLVRWVPGTASMITLLPPGPQVADFHQAVAVTADGEVRVGNRDGLLSFDGETWDFVPKGTAGLDGEWISGLAADGDRLGVAHCCCFGEPRCRTDVFEAGMAVNIALHDVWALAADPVGRLWAATDQQGLVVLRESIPGSWSEAARVTNASTAGALPSNTLRSVTLTSGGTYLGTLQNGAVYWPNDGNPTQGADGSGWIDLVGLRDQNILSSARDGEEVWIGTASGLHRVSDGIVLLGLPTRLNDLDVTRSVQAVVVDGFRNVWAGTDAGILLLPAGGSSQLDYRLFTTENCDLTSNDILSGTLHPDGSVWFGTASGITRIDPATVLQRDAGDESFTLYPNPYNPRAGGFVTLALASGAGTVPADLDPAAGVMVFDATGARVGAFELVRDTWEWDGLNVNGDLVVPGIYLVTARDRSGEPVRLRLGVVR